MVRIPNPQYNKFKKPDGYVDLGWQIESDNKVIENCCQQNHKIRTFDNSFYLNRCTDLIYICDECKYIHHVDCSD